MGLSILAALLFYREAEDLNQNKLLWALYGALSYIIPYFLLTFIFGGSISNMIVSGFCSLIIGKKLVKKFKSNSDSDILDS